MVSQVEAIRDAGVLGGAISADHGAFAVTLSTEHRPTSADGGRRAGATRVPCIGSGWLVPLTAHRLDFYVSHPTKPRAAACSELERVARRLWH
jgi:hypothetical protein